MDSKQFQVETGLCLEKCCNCGVTFAVPDTFQQERKRDHQTFHCPSGHGQYYPGKSAIELARDDRDRAVREAERLKNCISHKKDIIRSKDYQVRHYKGEVTKLRHEAQRR